MKLYYSPGACSLSPHIALREAGLDFELVRVDLAAKKTATNADYLAINPKGYVPALQLDDGQVITEGPAIVQYVADCAPGKGLAPAAGSLERVRLQEWLTFIGTELHKSFGAFFNPKTPDDWKTFVRDLLGKRLGYIARQLEGRDFLMGSQFSVADCYLYTVLNWTPYANVDLAQWPVFAAYQARISARPAVQAALKAEGLVK